MKGDNAMLLCQEEMRRLLTRALNEDRLPECEIVVTNVGENPDTEHFVVSVKAAPSPQAAVVNRPPPPHDNAPEHEARHA